MIHGLFKVISDHRSVAVVLQYEEHLLAATPSWNSGIVNIYLTDFVRLQHKMINLIFAQ